MSPQLAATTACVFDAYGTLFDFLSASKRCRDALGDKADALGQLWRTKQLEYSWLRSLMGVHADFWHVTGDALDYALSVHGIEDPGLKDELMVLYLKLDAYPDAKAALMELKSRNMRTGILSNGSPSMLDAAVRSAGLDKLLDQVLSVEDVGIYKPSRRVYRLAMQKFAIHDAPSICFVSANPWDAQAAAQFGFQVVRIDRVGLPDDKIPGKPRALVKSLSELPELL